MAEQIPSNYTIYFLPSNTKPIHNPSANSSSESLTSPTAPFFVLSLLTAALLVTVLCSGLRLVCFAIDSCCRSSPKSYVSPVNEEEHEEEEEDQDISIFIEEKQYNILLHMQHQQAVLAGDVYCDPSTFAEWNMHQVAQWLNTLDDGRFAHYTDRLLEAFAADEIVAADLPALDQGDLKAFGINIFRDRRDLKQHIALLQESATSRQEESNVNGTEIHDLLQHAARIAALERRMTLINGAMTESDEETSEEYTVVVPPPLRDYAE